MKYSITKSSNKLIVTLDTESGNYSARITTFNDPNLILGDDNICFLENGKPIMYLQRHEIGLIDGVASVSLTDAVNKINVIISSLAVPTTPLTTSIPVVNLTKSFNSNNIDRPNGVVIKATTSPVIISIVTIDVFKHAANIRSLVGTLTISASGSNSNTLNVAGPVSKYEIFEFVVTSATTVANDILILKIEPVV